MENDYIDDGISRRVKPGAKLLMALVAVITVIAVWLVPVGEEEAPPSLPSQKASNVPA